MANTLLTIDMITNEALMVLENNLGMARKVNRQYDSMFARSGAKIGNVTNVRKPVRYTVASGPTLQIQDATETSVAVPLQSQRHVDFTFSSADLTLSIDLFSDRFIKPAVAALANQIDFDGLTLYRNVYQSVGTPGTTPAALLTYLQAGVKLDDSATPMDGMRNLVINPLAQATIVDALKGLFQSSTQISSQYRQGTMGQAIGFDWMMDQNVNVHTVGTYAGTPLTNGAGVEAAATLVTDGWSSGASTLNVGDVFTIGTTSSKGVYAVNPQNRQTTGQLQQFVVTATTSDTTGDMTIPISPSLISTGAFQTIDALPQDGAAITVVGTTGVTTPQNVAFHRDAFTLVMADLEMPSGVDMASRKSDPQTGVSMRCVRQYDINNDLFPCRIDVLYGWATLRPELACRIAG